MTRALLLTALCSLALTPVGAQSLPKPVVIYLHGRIIEDEGPNARSPEFGPYGYQAILDSLGASGFTVLSELRRPNTDMAQYAAHVAGQVDSLLHAGVPASRITVLGFSKGGGIAILTSARLRRTDVSFVFLAACGGGNAGVKVAGRLLSVFEESDQLGRSCAPMFSHALPGSTHAEVEIHTGLKHGAFYQPRQEWLAPVRAFVARAAAPEEADIILRNGRIWTGDTLRPYAEAIAIRGERLLAVGSDGEAVSHRTAHTRVIDLGGKFVTPGFIDDHTHFNQAGALLIGANLLDVSSAGPLAQRVKDAVARMSPGAWLTGGDWGAYEDNPANSTGPSGARPAGRFSPARAMIDSVSGSTPVLLNRWDRSAYLANGVALERAGLTCARPVAGLECVGGRATGRVADSALARIRRAITPTTFDQRLREARAAQAHLAALGVTTIHDITPPFQLPVYTELKRRGELTVRVFARPTLDKWNELRYAGVAPGFGDDWIRLRALKGFVDGIQGNSTARFYEPQLHSGKRGEWRDSTNTAATDGPGSGMMPPGNMEHLLFGLDSAGWWANVHAIGDEAIDTVLTVMEKVITTNGPKERRWRIIHSQVIRNAAVAERYKRLGIIAEVQPYHAIDDMRWMEERIGTRAQWAYAFKTFHDAGVPLLFGSDWPGTNASWYTASPMTILYAATTRQTLDGKPAGGWFPEQRLDLETSLRSYTINNAWAEGEEASKGSLEAGKLADLVVIDRDLFAIPPAQIKDAKVLLTMVGGRVVYADRPFVP